MQCVWKLRCNGHFVYIKSKSYFIYCDSTLVTRITYKFHRGFCRGFRQGFFSVMPVGENNGASGGSGGASSTSGRTSIALDSGCFEPFNPNGEPHSLSQRWKGWKRAFNLYVTGKGVSDCAQKRALFYMSQEWTFRKFTLHLLLRVKALLSRQVLDD